MINPFKFTLLAGIVCLSQSCSILKPNTGIPVKKVEFDFQHPKALDIITIRPRQSIEVVLKNVPVNAYEISIEDSIITYSTQQPTQFGSVFQVPDLAAVPDDAPDTESEIAGAVPPENTTAAKLKADERTKEQDVQKLIDDYKRLEQNLKDLMRFSEIVQEIEKLLSDCSQSVSQLETRAANYIVQAVPSLNASRANFPLGIEPYFNGEVSTVKLAITNMITRAETLKKELQQILSGADATMSLAQYRSLEKQVNEKISAVDKITKNLGEFKTKAEAFEKEKIGKAITDIYNKVLLLRKELHYVKTTGYKADEVLILVNFKKKAEVDCDIEFNSLPVVAIVRGGIKIDFSTGLSLNIGRKKFFDQKYRLDSVYRADNSIADSVAIRKNRNNNYVVPSLGFFMNIYSRSLSHINLGGTLGASFGTDQRLYYHIGALMIIGKSDRFIIGGGASVSRSEILDGQYDVDQVIRRAHSPAQVPVESATRVGWFLSFTYNLNLIN